MTGSSVASDETARARYIPEPHNDYRNPFQLDRDRLLYATNLARLAEVTQVVAADHGYVFHNRLTHSLKVAQIARRLAEKLNSEQPEEIGQLGGLDPDAAEAAGLAHDLGHPPFGHIAEEKLNEKAISVGLVDGFEGNAQSFRIVSSLAVGDAADSNGELIRGLNLTRRTLNGILKYPWLKGHNKTKPGKWGSYEAERGVFDWVREGFVHGEQVKSLEAEIMDWADDITYAVHDVVDFFCAGKIPLERLQDPGAAGKPERDAFFKGTFARLDITDADEQLRLTDAFSSIIEFFPPSSKFVGTIEQRWSVWQFITLLITRFVDAISIASPASLKSGSLKLVKIDESAQREIKMLKELTWFYVIMQNELALDQQGQIQMVDTVFDALSESAKKEKWNVFPKLHESLLVEAHGKTDQTNRLICDYISSMSEREITAISQRFSGR